MKTMKVVGSILLVALSISSCDLLGSTNKLSLWTQEGEADGAFQYVDGIIEAFVEMKAEEVPGLEITLENKATEVLREDFQTAALANNAADMVWTVSDHAGPFVNADIILALDDYVDTSKYLEAALAAVTLDGTIWGVPVSNGNHLMLMYNKDYVTTPPRNTDELIEMGKALTQGDRYGLVFDQNEPFWMTPWLGGFGGSVFEADGRTSTLNTPEMVATLQFLYDLKFVHNILPPESNYNGADTLFKEGKAAMIINGDWILGEYSNLLGEKFGVARIPRVTSTGEWPKPYTSGKFIMLSKALQRNEEKLDLVLEFVNFATNLQNQQDLVLYLTRLPALKEAYDYELSQDPMVNQILLDSKSQMEVGIPMPSVPEMRFNWDAMRPQMARVLSDKATPEQAALEMQNIVRTIIENQ